MTAPIELNGQAADYFTSQATPNSKGGQYLRSRLGADVVDDACWQLGYAPAGWTSLTNQLRRPAKPRSTDGLVEVCVIGLAG